MEKVEERPHNPFRFRLTDPSQLGHNLEPVAANVSAQPGGGKPFLIDVHACRLPNMGLFSVRIEYGRIFRTPSDYLAMTVPLDHELRFFDGEEPGDFLPGRVHILWPHDEMDLLIPKASSMLVATYPISWLRQYWREGAASRSLTTPVASDCLSLEVPEGRAYWRHLSFVWSEICNGAIFLQSTTAAHEIVKTSAALLMLAFESGAMCESADGITGEAVQPLELVEQYIRSNLGEEISLADLVTVSGTSASSLLRAFRIHRGVSPMKFVKQIRLEAAQRALSAAKAAETTVTEVAMDHGLYQLGRFSADYRRAFGELPSDTLSR